MKKCEIPKPKFSIGEHVVYMKCSDGNSPPIRDVGKVEIIDIKLFKGLTSVAYRFEGNEDYFGEDAVVRRVGM